MQWWKIWWIVFSNFRCSLLQWSTLEKSVEIKSFGGSIGQRLWLLHCGGSGTFIIILHWISGGLFQQEFYWLFPIQLGWCWSFIMQNTMNNPDGIFSFTWINHYYFLNCNYSSFSEAIATNNLQKLKELCCLETDKNHDFIASNWPNTVQNLDELKNHIKYIQQKPGSQNYD